MYYAEYCHYGIRVANARYLCRFETKQERNDWVNGDLYLDDYHRVEISYNDARHKYPDAFKANDESDLGWEFDEYNIVEMWPIPNKRFDFAKLHVGR